MLYDDSDDIEDEDKARYNKLLIQHFTNEMRKGVEID
jgi:hypothetical protein